MMWIDSSFAIEWLLGTERVAKFVLPDESHAILPTQYAEVMAYFCKRMDDPSSAASQLEALQLATPTRYELQQATKLYVMAREKRSKASLADAILAAVAINRKCKVLSFDADFAALGFREKAGVWAALSAKAT